MIASAQGCAPRPAPRAAAVAACAIVAVATAALPARADSSGVQGDPWEKFNRAAYSLESCLDRIVVHPLASLFHNLAPGPIGKAVHNVFVNLSEPSAFVNDVLQGRAARAVTPAARFIANSTVGVLGLFDVASHAGLVHHGNDFGVTLGRYGLGPGPYMYLPLIGPTTVRDLVGEGVDAFIDPVRWLPVLSRPAIGDGRAMMGGLDTEVTTKPQLDAILDVATDHYATLRSVYLQNREGEIRGGLTIQNLPPLDDVEPTSTPSSNAANPARDEPLEAAQTAKPPVVATQFSAADLGDGDPTAPSSDTSSSAPDAAVTAGRAGR